MAIRDFFKFSRKTFINPTGWLDWETLKEQNQFLWSAIRGTFTTPTPERTETFAQAMKRLKMSDADVKQAIHNYRLYALCFFILGCLVFLYSFYLLFAYWTFAGWLLGIAATAVFLSKAFQYDFWALQMRQKRLGLTFADWKNHLLGDKGPHS